MSKIKVFAPLFITLVLASCQQNSAPKATQDQQAGGNTLTSQSDPAPINAEDDTAPEGAVSAVPDDDYANQDDALNAYSVNAWPTIKEGSSGGDVKAAQYLLNARGSKLVVDGHFGPVTTSAVKAFQSRSGLSANGVLAGTTWAKLIKTVHQGDTGEAVKAVQSYLSLTIDGSFGPVTTNAVEAFQSRHGLIVDGLVGPQTWQALVSGTTGQPKPPINTGSERQKMLARGKAWVDINVPYNQQGHYDGWREDCSGFVSMVWNIRDSRGNKYSDDVQGLRYRSYELGSINDLQPGDAVSSAEKGHLDYDDHIVLFVKWIDKSRHIFLSYSETHKGKGTVAEPKQMYYTGGHWNMYGARQTSWHFTRRNGL